MKKKVLFAVLLLLTMGGVAGQGGNSSGRFEWVRGYAPGDLVNIIGSVTDSAGNLYILGSFNFASRWENGELLMPITPHDGATDGLNTLIAKISPEGEMVWKKVIHGNYFNSQPHDIKAMGDTAFACLVSMPLASRYMWYIYYLDTLVEPNWDPWPDYPISAEGMAGKCLALITFDFDGNVLEQHFLQMSYLDREGEDIYFVNPPGSGSEDYLSTDIPILPSFALGNDGSVYISRWVQDRATGGPIYGNYTLLNGDISAVKFWCDRRLVGSVCIDSTKYVNLQILKFSPHLDTLLDSRFVYHNDSIFSRTYTHLKSEKNKLYLMGNIIGVERGGTNYFDSTDNFGISMYRSHHMAKSFLLQYDSTLIPQQLVCLRDSIIDSLSYQGTYLFHDFDFDWDSNLVFVIGSAKRNVVGDTVSINSLYVISDSVTSLKQNSFVLILNENDLSLRNYGQLSTSNRSNSEVYPEFSESFVCKSNRIIIQYMYYGKIKFPNAIFQTPTIQNPGMGLAFFDYRGKLIYGGDYVSYSPNNSIGPVLLKDSVLYLCMRLAADATFGDIEVPSRGEYFACIAKYVDTAFMTPYVPPAPQGGGDGIGRVEPTTCELYPNPTVGEVTVQTDERIVRVSAYSMNGVRSDLKTDGNHVDVSALRQGVYLIEVVTEKTRYYTKFIKR